MKKNVTIILLISVTVFAGFVTAQDWTSKFDEAKMRERVKRLAADDFEGRGPGTDGGRRTAQYIADQMKSIGVRPGNKGSYFQNVKLVGVKADPNTKLEISGGKTSESYNFGDEFVATTGAQRANVAVESDLVFVGYGIDAPLYNWNDYKGSPDQYRGKILVMLVNDPPATASEPNIFGGKALTYFGRWTYKYEEAARRGAAGSFWFTQPSPPDTAGMSFELRTATGVTRSLERPAAPIRTCKFGPGRQMTRLQG